jgi:hypothetical protein
MGREFVFCRKVWSSLYAKPYPCAQRDRTQPCHQIDEPVLDIIRASVTVHNGAQIDVEVLVSKTSCQSKISIGSQFTGIHVGYPINTFVNQVDFIVARI